VSPFCSPHTSSAAGTNFSSSACTSGSDQTDRLVMTPLFHTHPIG